MSHVVKRSGRRGSEAFSQDKLHSSVQAACLSVRSPEGVAEQTAHAVTHIVSDWVSSKPSVTSHDIRRVAAKALEVFHPEAAYLYQTHEMVI
jgi:transcriptional regulator NrdR family protein